MTFVPKILYARVLLKRNSRQYSKFEFLVKLSHGNRVSNLKALLNQYKNLLT